jgi:hypothetical protein
VDSVLRMSERTTLSAAGQVGILPYAASSPMCLSDQATGSCPASAPTAILQPWIETNHYLSNRVMRDKLLRRSVESSSAIEGARVRLMPRLAEEDRG